MQKHLNKLRWLSLTLVWCMLLWIPMVSLYQTYLAAHAYDLLNPSQKLFYDLMEQLTSPLLDLSPRALDILKGNVWSGTLFGWRLSDPLAVLGQTSAARHPYWPFVVTAVIPVALTLLFGRFFCGWICPATLLYELNNNLALWLRHLGFHYGKQRFDRRLKYLVLAVGLLLSAVIGSVMVAIIYPPAIISRELYYVTALGGLGSGALFLILTLLFDLLVAQRGFCRYLCPGGALYSLLGRYRLLRIQRQVAECNDCGKCNAVCEFGLRPMRDDFGQECNNCTACIATCPTDALRFALQIHDHPAQGPGHIGPAFRRHQQKKP